MSSPKQYKIGKNQSKLHVSGVPFEWNDEDLLKIFSDRGAGVYVIKAIIKREPNGKSKGYGKVVISLQESDPTLQWIINSVSNISVKKGLVLKFVFLFKKYLKIISLVFSSSGWKKKSKSRKNQMNCILVQFLMNGMMETF